MFRMLLRSRRYAGQFFKRRSWDLSTPPKVPNPYGAGYTCSSYSKQSVGLSARLVQAVMSRPSAHRFKLTLLLACPSPALLNQRLAGRGMTFGGKQTAVGAASNRQRWRGRPRPAPGAIPPRHLGASSE